MFTARRAVGARCKYCLNNLSRWIPLGSAFPRAAFEPEHQDIGCCGLSAVHGGRKKKKDKIPGSHRCSKFWVYNIGNIFVLRGDCGQTPTHPGSPSTESQQWSRNLPMGKLIHDFIKPSSSLTRHHRRVPDVLQKCGAGFVLHHRQWWKHKQGIQHLSAAKDTEQK